MDSETIKLSIIIPAYNASAYIEKCIRSCENQDLAKTEYEIIVVDDGSTDSTKECVQQLRCEFSNIVYIYQNNARQGAARNNGLRNARGQYIWYVDADDWIEENCLCGILDRIDKEQLTALAVRHAKYYGNILKLWPAMEGNVKSGKEVLNDRDLLVSPTYCIWKKEYLLNNRLFFLEHIFHEDTEIYPRMYYNAERIGFYNQVCYYIFESSNSTTRSGSPQRAHDVITVVQYLQQFCERIEQRDVQKAIRQYICATINTSLYNSLSMKADDVKDLNTHWAENKCLFDYLIKSNVWKYRVEGLLFKLFPKHVILIYRLMQKGNPDPGKMKEQTK